MRIVTSVSEDLIRHGMWKLMDPEEMVGYVGWSKNGPTQAASGDAEIRAAIKAELRTFGKYPVGVEVTDEELEKFVGFMVALTRNDRVLWLKDLPFEVRALRQHEHSSIVEHLGKVLPRVGTLEIVALYKMFDLESCPLSGRHSPLGCIAAYLDKERIPRWEKFPVVILDTMELGYGKTHNGQVVVEWDRNSDRYKVRAIDKMGPWRRLDDAVAAYNEARLTPIIKALKELELEG